MTQATLPEQLRQRQTVNTTKPGNYGYTCSFDTLVRDDQDRLWLTKDARLYHTCPREDYLMVTRRPDGTLKVTYYQHFDEPYIWERTKLISEQFYEPVTDFEFSRY